MILVDNRFKTLTELVLKEEAVIFFKDKRTTVKKLMKMTVAEFYETFFPEKNLTAQYQVALNKVKNITPRTRELFNESKESLKDLENLIKSKSKKELILEAEERHDSITYTIADHIDQLELDGLIDSTLRDQLKMFQYGKINPYSLCGETRPDVAIMSFHEGNLVFDFVHVSEGAVSNNLHKIGSDFYQDFFLVLFGKAPDGEHSNQGYSLHI